MLAQQLAEVAACDVFTRADQGGQVITMALVKQRLAELRAHPDDCGAVLVARASGEARGRVPRRGGLAAGVQGHQGRALR